MVDMNSSPRSNTSNSLSGADDHGNSAGGNVSSGGMTNAFLHWSAGDISVASSLYLQEALSSNSGAAYSSYLYSLYFRDDVKWAHILEEHARWGDRLAASPRHSSGSQRPSDEDNRKLRVGFISPCFRNHIQGLLIEPIIKNLDPGKFETFAYYTCSSIDDQTIRCKNAFMNWRHLGAPMFEPLYEALLHDRLDVAIDLNLHMDRSSIAVLSKNPARVNASWLAYPGVSGLTGVSRLWDAELDLGTTESYHLEPAIPLKHGLWCFPVGSPTPGVLDRSLESSKLSVFGCLNNPAKLSNRLLKLWAKLLARVPDAKLALLFPTRPEARKLLCSRLRSAGIDVHRVIPRSYSDRTTYLSFYRDIDVVLDTLPYNGHMTTLDALWMGVPVVSLVGETPVGRAGRSILRRLGFESWAAQNEAEYIEVAITLLRCQLDIEKQRSDVRHRLRTSPLAAPEVFACDLGQAIERLYSARVPCN